MFCPKCGKENNDSDAFCVNCGGKLTVELRDNQTISDSVKQKALVSIKTRNLISFIFTLVYTIVIFLFFTSVLKSNHWVLHSDEFIMFLCAISPALIMYVLLLISIKLSRMNALKEKLWLINLHFIISILLCCAIVLLSIFLFIITYGSSIILVIASILQIIVSSEFRKLAI